MGAAFTKRPKRSSPQAMAMLAVCWVMHLTREQILDLKDSCRELAREENPKSITRLNFSKSLRESDVNTNDIEILDRIFTMFDDMSDDIVQYLDFLAGICPLVRDVEDVQGKIELCFKMYDLKGDGTLTMGDMVHALTQINRAASFFGDAVLTDEEIASIVFKDDGGEQTNSSLLRTAERNTRVNFYDHLQRISRHCLVRKFLAGEGSVYYS